MSAPVADRLVTPLLSATASPDVANDGAVRGRVSAAEPERFVNEVTPAPRTDPAGYRLTVAGLVSRTWQFSLSDLRLLFADQAAPDASGEESAFQGCHLEDVLGFVGVSQPAAYLELIGVQGPGGESSHEPAVGFLPLRDLQADQPILLAWAKGGRALGSGEGAPLTAVVPEGGSPRLIRGLHRVNLLVLPPLWAVR